MVKNPIPPYNRQSNQFIATTIIFFIDADDNDITPNCTDDSRAIELDKIKLKTPTTRPPNDTAGVTVRK